MSIFLPGLPDLPTGLYFLSVDNSKKDETVYTIGRHLRHSPPNFEMIRGLDIFYSGQPVSVPQGHGRLIDADARVDVQLYNDELEDFQTVNMSIDDLLDSSWIELEDAPTIIPAEPDEAPEEESDV